MASDTEEMEVDGKAGVQRVGLQDVLTEKELSAIEKPVVDKLKGYYLVLKVVSSVDQSGTRDGDLSLKLIEMTTKYEDVQARLTTCQLQVEDLNNDIIKYKEKVSHLESDCKLANDDSKWVKETLTKRDKQIQELKDTLSKFSDQLTTEIKGKCHALTLNTEIKNNEHIIKQHQKSMEEQSRIMFVKLSEVTKELTKVRNESQSCKINSNNKIKDLESKLRETTVKLNLSNDTNTQLQELIKKLSNQAETLSSKLLAQKEMDTKLQGDLMKDFNTKAKLADIYKMMHDQSASEIIKQKDVIANMQSMLDGVAEKYDFLETEHRQDEINHKEMIAKQTEQITQLEAALEQANEKLKIIEKEELHVTVKDISPSALIAHNLFESDMTLGELHNELIRVNHELNQEKEKNKRLNNEMLAIVNELGNRVPDLKKEKEEYEDTFQANIKLKQNLEGINKEFIKLKDEYHEALKLSSFHRNESSRLKKEITDLGNQVCFLLREIERHRGQSLPNGDHDPTRSPFADNSLDSINNTATFSDIQELQIVNQNLRRKLRDLEEKRENTILINNEELSEKIVCLENKIAELTNLKLQHLDTINSLQKQRDMYKKLHHDSMSSKHSEMLVSMDITEMADYELTNADSKLNTMKEMENLRKKLCNTEMQLNNVKKEYNTIRDEKSANDKILYEEVDTLRNEISQLRMVNTQYNNKALHRNEQLNILNAQLESSEIKNNSLKKEVSDFHTIITDRETVIQLLRNTYDVAQKQILSLEEANLEILTELDSLKQLNLKLQCENKVYKSENEHFTAELQKLEIIKETAECAQYQKFNDIEIALQEYIEICAALKKRNHDEYQRSKLMTSHLEAELTAANKKLNDECELACQMRQEIIKLKSHLEKSNKRNLELEQDLNLMVVPSNTNSIFTTKHMDLHISKNENEVKLLREQVTRLKDEIKKCCVDSHFSEQELIICKKELENFKIENEKVILNYKKEINDLQQHCSEIKAELSLLKQSDCQDTNDTIIRNELNELKDKLTNTMTKFKKCEEERDTALLQLHKLSEFKNESENIYAQEYELKLLAAQQKEVQKDTRPPNDNIIQKIKLERKQFLGEIERMLKKRNDDLLGTIDALNSQNTILNDQIDVLSTQVFETLKSFLVTESCNDSNISTLINEGEPQQLLQYLLTKEKVADTSKCEMMRTEMLRLRSQLESTEKELENTKLALQEQRNYAGINISAALKEADILRKIETLNALSDSNEVLRAERDGNLARIEELTTNIKTVQDELPVLHAKVTELTSINESISNENVMLKQEAEQWKSRTNTLVENANKISPDEWKHLQTECDSLTKIVFAEKDKARKKNEELELMKTEKSNIEEKYLAISRQYTVLVDEHKILSEKFHKNVRVVASLTEELSKLKTQFDSATKENEKLVSELSIKETSLSDIRNKEIQIRKIAKKYKGQYEDLVKTVQEEKKKTEEENEKGQIVELKRQLEVEKANLEAEKANLEKLNTEVKSSMEKEEKAKQLLKAAKSRIVLLNEAKNKFAAELEEAKTKIESIEQSNHDEQDVRLALIKSQYDGKVARLEKEKEEIQLEKTKEVEALMQKINVLQRQAPSVSGISKQAVSTEKTTAEPPTANIKPMTASSMSGPRPAAAAPVRPVAAVSCLESTEYMPASSSLAESGTPALLAAPPREPRAIKRPRPPPPGRAKRPREDEERDQEPSSSHQGDEGVVLLDSEGENVEEGDEREAGDQNEPTNMESEAGAAEEQVLPPRAQIEAISSGTEPGGGEGGEEGEDGIVPSTPVLRVPRAGDGFGEAVVSPLAGGARFSFAEDTRPEHEPSHSHSHPDLAAAMPQLGEENREAEASGHLGVGAVPEAGGVPGGEDPPPGAGSPAVPGHSAWSHTEGHPRGEGRGRRGGGRRPHRFMRY